MLKSTYVPSAAAAAATAPLPPGWTQHTAPTGHSYYYNAETKESTYKRPGLAPAPESAPSLPYAPYGGMPSLADPNVANAYMAQLNRGSQQQQQQQQGRHDQAKTPARPRPQPIDRPRSKTPIPGHEPWILVYTKYSRRFVYNSAKNASYWRIPDKLMPAILEMDKKRIRDKTATDADPNGTKAGPNVELDSEYEEIEVTDDDDDDDDDNNNDDEGEGEGEDAEINSQHPKKRIRTHAKDETDQQVQEDEQDAGPLEFTEEDIAMQLQMMGDDYGLEPKDDGTAQDWPPPDSEEPALSQQDAQQLFTDLLDDLRVSPYSPWEKLLEDGKMVEDPRYTALSTTRARKECHDAWSRARIAQLRAERAATQQQQQQQATTNQRDHPRIAFVALLQEKATTTKLFWPEFRRKYRKEHAMRDSALADRDREKMYREHMARLKRPAATLKADLLALLSAQAPAQLNSLSLRRAEGGGGAGLPGAVLADLRYISLAPAVRDPLIEAFVQGLPPPPPPAAGDGDADGGAAKQ